MVHSGGFKSPDLDIVEQWLISILNIEIIHRFVFIATITFGDQRKPFRLHCHKKENVLQGRRERHDLYFLGTAAQCLWDAALIINVKYRHHKRASA